MTKKNRFIVATVVFSVAALAGSIFGKYYSLATTGQAQASDGMSLPADMPDPEWTDLNVVYLLDEAGTASDPVFEPTTLAAKINAKAVTQFNDVARLSQGQRLDVFIIEASALDEVPQGWAKSQYAHGTAFVGFNLTPHDLGTLIGDDDFANNQDWINLKFSKPFVAQTMYRVTGNPGQIQKLEKINALFPITEQTENTWIELGVTDVTVVGTQGYTDVTSENLITQLDNIRINISLEDIKKP